MKRLALVTTLALAACGGGGSALPNGSNAHAPQAQTAPLSFAIKIPAKASASRRGQYVSASTASVTLTVTYSGSTPPSPVSQTFSVTPGSGSCPTTSGTTTCTFTLNVPVTSATTTATLGIVASDASSVAVASASIPVTIYASGANQITATLGGVVASLRTLISPPSVPATPATSVPVTVEAFDNGGNVIVGSYTDASGNAASVTVTSSDPTHEPVAPSSIASSSTSVSLAYDGTLSAGAGAKVTATAGSSSSSATLAIVATGTPNSTAYFETSNNTVVAVAIGNSGSTAIRTLTTSASITNAGITVAPDGTVYALVGANTIDVFSPGQSSGGPLYTISDSNFSSGAPITSIAAVRGGTYLDGVLVGGGSTGLATVDTFAKGATAPAVHAPLYTSSGPVWSVASSSSGNTFVTTYDGSYAQLDGYINRVPSYSAIHSGYLGDLQNEDIHDTTLSSLSGYPWFPVPTSSATANPQLAVDDYDSQVFLYTTNGVDMYGETADSTYSGSLGYSGAHPSNVNIPSSGIVTLAYDGAGNLYTFGGNTLTEYSRASVQGGLGSTSSTALSSASTTTVSGLTLLAGTVGP